VEDLDSAIGTFVNDQRIKCVPLTATHEAEIAMLVRVTREPGTRRILGFDEVQATDDPAVDCPAVELAARELLSHCLFRPPGRPGSRPFVIVVRETTEP